MSLSGSATMSNSEIIEVGKFDKSLGEPPSKTKLEDWRLRVIQIDTSPEGGGGRGHWDTDTEMCDDLAWCLDTLGQSSSLHCALPGLSNTAAQQEKQEIAIRYSTLSVNILNKYILKNLWMSDKRLHLPLQVTLTSKWFVTFITRILNFLMYVTSHASASYLDQ